MGSAYSYSKEECFEAIRRATERLGHPPSRSEYRQLDITPSAQTINRRCGSWSEAKWNAGYDADMASGERYTQAECLQAVAQLTKENRRSPTVTEYRESGRHPSVKTITGKVAGWKDVRDLAVACVKTQAMCGDDEPLDDIAAVLIHLLERHGTAPTSAIPG